MKTPHLLKGILALVVLSAIILVTYFIFGRTAEAPIVNNPLTNASSTALAITAITTTPGPFVTKYFGNDITGDFDSDGNNDTAFIITKEDGDGSIFYYVTAVLNTKNGKVNVPDVLLGDRIAPQTMSIEKNLNGNILVVNYVVRKAGEGFDVPPSVGKTLRLKLDVKTNQFGEVAQNFEGEADPSKMNLTMKKWVWVNTIYNNDTTVTPKQPDRFTLTFKSDKTFSASTDCNGVGGEYVVNGNKITFTKMMSTLMYCEGSQESDFSKMIGEVQTYMFTSKGELVLELKLDSGSMIFK